MTKVTTAPHRYYIDRDHDHAVVRAVPTARPTSPATHRVEAAAMVASSVTQLAQPRPEPTPNAPRHARVGKLVQQAIRRRSH
jgi:hypothetical protein